MFKIHKLSEYFLMKKPLEFSMLCAIEYLISKIFSSLEENVNKNVLLDRKLNIILKKN
jgi:hypothetical protein